MLYILRDEVARTNQNGLCLVFSSFDICTMVRTYYVCMYKYHYWTKAYKVLLCHAWNYSLASELRYKEMTPSFHLILYANTFPWNWVHIRVSPTAPLNKGTNFSDRSFMKNDSLVMSERKTTPSALMMYYSGLGL